MVTATNTRVLFKEIPRGYPEPDKVISVDRTENIDIENVELHGGILVKTIVLSIDPYMRGRMRDESIESYAPAYKLGHPIDNHGVALVVRSEHESYKKGCFVYGFIIFAEYSVIQDPSSFRILPFTSGLSWSACTGVAGFPGLTAYAAWQEYAKAQKSETVFVSGGAGAVGSFVVQLAKQDGMKVIASAGSDAKVEFMKSIGADVAFNYKTASTNDQLEKEGPINVYWDNVGGETLDTALAHAAIHARFIECGMISGYNETMGGLKNAMNIVSKRISIKGFTLLDLIGKYAEEFWQVVPKAVAEGKIKYAEHFYHGLDAVGQAIFDVQTGANQGKPVILVADP